MKLFDTPQGKIIISILWGLGMATLFRKVCKDNCIIIETADPKVVQNTTYQFKENQCVKFNPTFVKCPSPSNL